MNTIFSPKNLAAVPKGLKNAGLVIAELTRGIDTKVDNFGQYKDLDPKSLGLSDTFHVRLRKLPQGESTLGKYDCDMLVFVLDKPIYLKVESSASGKNELHRLEVTDRKKLAYMLVTEGSPFQYNPDKPDIMVLEVFQKKDPKFTEKS